MRKYAITALIMLSLPALAGNEVGGSGGSISSGELDQSIAKAGNEGGGFGSTISSDNLEAMFEAGTLELDQDKIIELQNNMGDKAILLDRSIVDSIEPEVLIQNSDFSKTLLTIEKDKFEQLKAEIELESPTYELDLPQVGGTFVPVK